MMEQLVEILHRGGHSLVVASNSGIRTFNGRGISDLYAIYTTLSGAELADKVVGKGAAALMDLGGVRRVHADVLSRPALALLELNGISVTYTTLVDNIINRQGTGICPVETLCMECLTAAECLPKITAFISNLKN